VLKSLCLPVKSGKLRSGLSCFNVLPSVNPDYRDIDQLQANDYIYTKATGYDKDQVVKFEGPNILGNKSGKALGTLLELSSIQNVTKSDLSCR